MTNEEQEIPSTVVLNEPLISGRKQTEPLTSTGKLVCTTPKLLEDGAPREFWLTKSEEIVGSAPECSVQIKSQAVSPIHARVTAFSKQWLIENSVNGSGLWVNDVPVESRSKLSSGDAVKLGDLAFQFDVLDVAPTEFATVPQAPEDEQGKTEVRFARTLQLELNADGELVDVSQRGVADIQSKPARTEARSAAKLALEKAKIVAQADALRAPDKDALTSPPGLEAAHELLQSELPSIIEMLVQKAREGDVEAACACLLYAGNDNSSGVKTARTTKE